MPRRPKHARRHIDRPQFDPGGERIALAEPTMIAVSSRNRRSRTLSGNPAPAAFIASHRSSMRSKTRRSAGVSAGRRKSSTAAPSSASMSPGT
jgi:hypothetical protein